MVWIPWNDLGADIDEERIRMDVSITEKGGGITGWCDLAPVTSRLVLRRDNPNDLGWLIKEKDR